MKKLKFLYQMDLGMDSPVTRHSFALRCVPKRTFTQEVGSLTCEIKPATSISRVADCFDNIVYIGYVDEAHDSFSFKISGEVSRDDSRRTRENLNPIFKYASQYATLSKPLKEYFSEYERPSGDIVAQAQYLMELIYKNFDYVQGVTNTTTTAEEALGGGQGVCQDYAHILIAMCRMIGIPARYITGFMIGEGATHAWVEVFAYGQWIGLDPTNCKMADEYYIKLADGRDYGDCIIDRGIFFGNAKQFQSVKVSVEG